MAFNIEVIRINPLDKQKNNKKYFNISLEISKNKIQRGISFITVKKFIISYQKMFFII